MNYTKMFREYFDGTSSEELIRRYPIDRRNFKLKLIKYCKINGIELPEEFKVNRPKYNNVPPKRKQVSETKSNKTVTKKSGYDKMFEDYFNGVNVNILIDQYNLTKTKFISKLVQYYKIHNMEFPEGLREKIEISKPICQVYNQVINGEKSISEVSREHKCSYAAVDKQLKNYERILFLNIMKSHLQNEIEKADKVEPIKKKVKIA